ncbi:MAG: hypothetical protein ACXVC6_10510 [Bacteroidia bacterium]
MQRILFFASIISASLGALAQSDTISNSQKSTGLCEIRLIDGSSYKGRIENQTDSVIFLKSSGGVLVQLPKHNVSSVDFISGHALNDTINGISIHHTPVGANHYTTSSNAFLFNKGEISGSNSYFIFGSIHYAINRNFAVGIASSIIGVPMGLHVKANFEVGHKLYIGAEGTAASLMYLGPKTYGEGGTMKLTYGDEYRHFTLYAGYFDVQYFVQPVRRAARKGRPAVYKRGNYYIDVSSPFAGIAFASRIAPRTNFVCDFFAFPSIYIYTTSFGIRGMSRQRVSWTGGFQLIINQFPTIKTVYTAPYWGFSYRL